jgi:hypothetical protein
MHESYTHVMLGRGNMIHVSKEQKITVISLADLTSLSRIMAKGRGTQILRET